MAWTNFIITAAALGGAFALMRTDIRGSTRMLSKNMKHIRVWLEEESGSSAGKVSEAVSKKIEGGGSAAAPPPAGEGRRDGEEGNVGDCAAVQGAQRRLGGRGGAVQTTIFDERLHFLCSRCGRDAREQTTGGVVERAPRPRAYFEG
eukprot:CAMPEP_0182865140 /NCGR_PEP_ID=MMETSP0034_2-20130328/7537_1 /TAXON_ID=156128 /ORGANISM="Nephroselmis pyriformis, Strain CCMP717" /LENGTH=146 /DNA_ID=CAMNT_0024997427 /DNA_START=160 /DNA_END=598 /DNA_ORIENTATION=+